MCRIRRRLRRHFLNEAIVYIALAVTTTASVTVPNGALLSNQLHQKFVLCGLAASQNWSGYIDKANQNPYTEITGSWTVPSIPTSNYATCGRGKGNL